MHDCDVDRFIILTVCTLGFISPCGNKQAGHRIYWTQRNRFSCWTSSFAVQHTAVMSIKHTDVCSQQRLRYDLKKKKKQTCQKAQKGLSVLHASEAWLVFDRGRALLWLWSFLASVIVLPSKHRPLNFTPACLVHHGLEIMHMWYSKLGKNA